jgi:hypothetical protein
MSTRREFALVLIGAAALTVALTYPVAFKLGHAARVDNADGQLSIWNVAWVARTLIVDPRHVFDANIFYPHRETLAYSESNLAAGSLAIPVYWATRNPYAAYNSVVLIAFALSGIGMYCLVRRLTGDRRAAAVSGICFAFCPYMFARFSHIQLLMTAGLPFAMWAFHRVVDRPGAARGAVLGMVLAVQALGCGYYGVFAILLVGYAAIVVATTRSLWKDWSYWIAIGTAAAVSIALVVPAFLPYLRLARVEGGSRTLEMANSFRANWSAYLASSSHAHAWLLQYLPPWSEVLFPGVIALTFGVAGGWIARRQRRGELTWLYGGAAVLAFWASFGPPAGLYSLLYSAIPLFAWLRAPARFGLLVVFALSVLAGVAVSSLLRRTRYATGAAIVIAMMAVGELVVHLEMPEAPPVEQVYRTLATLPRGAVIEMPFFYPEVGLFQHTKYMLASTAHWMPLVNGYSDYIPPDFHVKVEALKFFPSRDAFKTLEPDRVRYAVFHLYGYNTENRRDVLSRLKEFDAYLRPLYTDEATRLYEIVSFPP